MIAEGRVEVNGVAHGVGIRGYSVSTVQVDRRHSVYSRMGDKFAFVCAVVGLLLYVDYVLVRATASRRAGAEAEGAA